MRETGEEVRGAGEDKRSLETLVAQLNHQAAFPLPLCCACLGCVCLCCACVAPVLLRCAFVAPVRCCGPDGAVRAGPRCVRHERLRVIGAASVKKRVWREPRGPSRLRVTAPECNESDGE